MWGRIHRNRCLAKQRWDSSSRLIEDCNADIVSIHLGKRGCRFDPDWGELGEEKGAGSVWLLLPMEFG